MKEKSPGYSDPTELARQPPFVCYWESTADQLVVIRVVSKPSCDFNGDGFSDVSYIDLLTGVGDISLGMSVPPADPVFDLDTNDAIDIGDVDQWLAAAASQDGFSAPYSSGDADLSGVVDAADLNALALNWRQNVANWSGRDFTGNGTVDAVDLNQLALNWQESIPLAAATQNVPEPKTAILVVFGVVCILRRHRSRNTQCRLEPRIPTGP